MAGIEVDAEGVALDAAASELEGNGDTRQRGCRGVKDANLYRKSSHGLAVGHASHGVKHRGKCGVVGNEATLDSRGLLNGYGALAGASRRGQRGHTHPFGGVGVASGEYKCGAGRGSDRIHVLRTEFVDDIARCTRNRRPRDAERVRAGPLVVEVGGHAHTAHHVVGGVTLGAAREAQPHLVVDAGRNLPVGLSRRSTRVGNAHPRRAVVLRVAELVGASVGLGIPAHRGYLARNQDLATNGVGQFDVGGHRGPGDPVLLGSALGDASRYNEVVVACGWIEDFKLLGGVQAVHSLYGGAVKCGGRWRGIEDPREPR